MNKVFCTKNFSFQLCISYVLQKSVLVYVVVYMLENCVLFTVQMPCYLDDTGFIHKIIRVPTAESKLLPTEGEKCGAGRLLCSRILYR